MARENAPYKSIYRQEKPHTDFLYLPVDFLSLTIILLLLLLGIILLS